MEAKFKKFMLEKTEREYECSLSIMEGAALTDAKDQGCGGIILFSAD